MVCTAHVVPPSVLATMAPAPVVGSPRPTATHAEAVGHATATRGPVLAGKVCEVQVAPPVVVVTTTPVDRSVLAPTATHDVVDEQLMAVISPAPAGRVWGVQVLPPSVVVIITPAEETVPPP